MTVYFRLAFNMFENSIHNMSMNILFLSCLVPFWSKTTPTLYFIWIIVIYHHPSISNKMPHFTRILSMSMMVCIRWAIHNMVQCWNISLITNWIKPSVLQLKEKPPGIQLYCMLCLKSRKITITYFYLHYQSVHLFILIKTYRIWIWIWNASMSEI